MTGRGWWRDPSWWRQEAWKYVGLALSIAFLVIVGRAIWLDYPLDSSEVREWVGALSGWVAAAAAVITINYVSRQTRAAERAFAAEAEERRDREARAAEALADWVEAAAAVSKRGREPGMFADSFRSAFPSGPRQAIENAKMLERDKAVLRALDDAIRQCNSLPSNGVGAQDYMRSRHDVEVRLSDAEIILSTMRDRQVT